MHRLWWLIFTLCTCRASEGLEPSSDEALRVTPSALDFAPSIVGTRKTMVITVQNPTRVTRTVDTRTSAPFEVAEHLEIGGGASVELVVTFAPTEVVRSDAVISIGEHQVSVTGSGVAVPTCAAPTFCSTERFDFRTETCVEDRAPDGTDCTASNACFASALCERGECVSVSTTCDDGEPCTTDFCTATGCTHTPAACPVTDSLCEAPVCINGVGCSTAPVPDGTSCGRRTCDDARVCINARCTSRPVPIGQTCVDVMAGQAAGCGHLDGPADEARLRSVKSGAFDLEGTLYFADGQTIRRLSRNGLVHTLAGAPEETGFVDGPGAFARFTDPTILGIDAQGNIITIEASWRLRRVTPAGFVTTWALAPTTEHWAVMATLEVSGEVTVWTGPGSTLFRVSRSGRVTQQIAKPPPDLDTLSNFRALSSGSEGVWVCDQPPTIIGTWGEPPPVQRVSRTYEILPTGELVAIAIGCHVQVRNAGVITNFWATQPFWADSQGHHVYFDPRACQLVDGFGKRVAGPTEDAVFIDGSDEARLLTAPRSMTPRADGLLFADDHHIRQWSPRFGVETIRTEPMFAQVMALAASGDLLAISANESFVLDLTTQAMAPATPWYYPATGYAWSSGGLLVSNNSAVYAQGADGGFALGLFDYPDALGSSNVAGAIVARRKTLFHLEFDAGSMMLIDADKEISGIAEEPNGNIVFISQDSTIVRRARLDVTPARIDDLVDLHVQPGSITVTHDGRIWLGIPHALLRLRLP